MSFSKTIQNLFLRSILIILCFGVFAGVSRLLWAESIACSDHLSDLPEARSAWKNGDLVMLIRHAERCREAQHNCSPGDLGLTPAGVFESFLIASGLDTLGPAPTDFYHSPTLRTRMTSDISAHQRSSEASWLVDHCKENFAERVQQEKVAGRNLVMVTHSTCINAFEASTTDFLSRFNAGNNRFYGASLMYSYGLDDKPAPIGCILPENWQSQMPELN